MGVGSSSSCCHVLPTSWTCGTGTGIVSAVAATVAVVAGGTLAVVVVAVEVVDVVVAVVVADCATGGDDSSCDQRRRWMRLSSARTVAPQLSSLTMAHSDY